MANRVAELIRTLGLVPHPEGGSYREIWRAPLDVEPGDQRGRRAALTQIFYLLPAGAVSRWHRVRSDEIWHHYEGAPLELLRIPPDPTRIERARLGPLVGDEQPVQAPVQCVPAHWWQAARSLGDYTLVGCTVGPGFEFADFQMLSDGTIEADTVRQRHPHLGVFI